MNPSSGSYYVDEEDCLGFKVWVAELELMVGNARGKKKVEPRQCFQLLQKLVVTLDRTGRMEVREYQRRCEGALIDILLKGAPPPVRKLICGALGKLYSLGDQLPLYSRVSSLQLFLGTKEAFSKETSEDVRLGAIECMTSLYYSQGHFLSIGVNETATIAAKHCAKSMDEKTRCAALGLLAAAVEGVGGNHRNALAVQQDSFRTAEKFSKDRDSDGVRLAAVGVVGALARAGGMYLWAQGLGGYEDAKAMCLAGLDDPHYEMRAACARALGELVVASTSGAALDSVKALEKKPKAMKAQERALSEVVGQCLVTPFVDAAVASNRAALTAMAQAWVVYLTAMRSTDAVDGPAFVDLAMRVLEVLGAACAAAGSYQEKAIASGEGELGMGIGSGERPHAQACVLYVLRVAVIEQLSEAGQRLLLDKLLAVLSATLGAHTPVAVVTLEAVALLLEILGEVSVEAREGLEGPICAKLTGVHCCLRLQAAGALAALSVAEPSSAGRLLQMALFKLQQAAGALAEASAASSPDRSKPYPPSTPRGVGVAKLKPAMNAVHGWALGLAALLAASGRLPLGVPAAVVTSALQLAAALILAPHSKQVHAVCSEREAGYILLGPLCLALPAELLVERQVQLLELFAPALGADAASSLDKLYTSNASNLDAAVSADLWWRSAALQALLSYVLGVVLPAPQPDQKRLCKKVAALLRPTLDVVTAHAALQDPSRARGGASGMLAGAAALLQLRLLEVYLALPNPAVYVLEQEALTKLSMRAVRGAATGGGVLMAESALRPWLDRSTAHLGPWPLGQDPLESALLGYEGVAGGPAAHPWEVGRRAGVGYAMAEEPGTGRGAAPAPPAPYPQPRGLGAALLDAQLSLMGVLLGVVSPPNQAAILEALLSIVVGGPQRRKDKDPARRQAAATTVAAAALAGLGRLQKGWVPPELCLQVRALAEEVGEESGGSLALQRATADLYAAAAVLAPDDSLALQLIKSLCHEAAETTSLPRRAMLALAVGQISSAVGGLSIQAVLPTAVQTLIAVAEASSKLICAWVLQALLACANAAGLAFVQHVKTTLAFAQNLLLSEDIYCVPGLLPAIGRLANAMVAVLGPEYTLGSSAYLTCKGIINDMQSLERGGGSVSQSPIDCVSAALETVLYAQMLVLFAPKAVPAKSHVQVLLHTLLSRQPRLRKAAADTLRHLAERDAGSVLAERVEPVLFSALDGETDPGIASQIKATLRTLLLAGAPQEPSRWLALCSDVVMAAAPGTTALHTPRASGVPEEGGGDDDDDEEEEEEEGGLERGQPRASNTSPSAGRGPSSAAAAGLGPRSGAGAGPATSPAAGGALGHAGATAALPAKMVTTPRLRTRLFAAGCLLQIPGLVCGTDPRHCDLASAQRAAGGGDWLVLRLQLLVDMAFKMASGQLEALRPSGVKLMKAVVKRFGDTEDPLAEGQKLLELYQAQITSTIRASLAPGSSPTLQAAGATLAACFLEKGLSGGDTVVLERLMALLAAPLAQWVAPAQQQHGQLYAEWVDVRAKVALLDAHAHCAVLAASSADDVTRRVITRAQHPHADLLLGSWLGLLEDYVVLTSQPPAVQLAYRPKLCTPAAVPGPAPCTQAGGEESEAAAAAESAPPAAPQPPMPSSAAHAAAPPRAETPAAADASSEAASGPAVGGPPPVAIIASVKPYLQRSWGASLDACTCLLAQEVLAARGDRSGGRAQRGDTPDSETSSPHGRKQQHQQYQTLLDLCQMAVCTAAAADASCTSAHGGPRDGWRAASVQGGLGTALVALRRLTAPIFAEAAFLTVDSVAELAALLLHLLMSAEGRHPPAPPPDSTEHRSAAVVGEGQQQQQRPERGGPYPAATLAQVLEQLAAAVQAQLAQGAPKHPLLATTQQQLLGAAELCARLTVPEGQHWGASTQGAAEVRQGQGQGPSDGRGADCVPAAAPAEPGGCWAALQHALGCAKLVVGTAAAAAEGQEGAGCSRELQRALSLGVDLLLGGGVPQGQLPAVAAFLGDVAAVAAPALQPQPGRVEGDREPQEGLPTPLLVLAAATGSVAQHARCLVAGEIEAGALGPTLSAMLALAAVLALTAPASTVQHHAGAANSAGLGTIEDGDWGEEGAFEEAPLEPTSRGGAAAQEGAEEGAPMRNGPAAGAVAGAEAAVQVEAALQLCQAVLRQAAGSSVVSTRQQLLHSLRTLLQQHAASAQWMLQCAAVVLPDLAAWLHGKVQAGAHMSEQEVQVAAEVLKLILVASTTAGTYSQSHQAALLQLLVPLLVELAAPLGPSIPALADMSLKLITHLATSQTAAAFKGVVAGMPLGTKQRLQQALQGSGGAAPASRAGAAKQESVAQPTIQLKSFATLNLSK